MPYLLVPAVFVSLSIGYICAWLRSYRHVVEVDRMLQELHQQYMGKLEECGRLRQELAEVNTDNRALRYKIAGLQ